jgi:hypothetical protein
MAKPASEVSEDRVAIVSVDCHLDRSLRASTPMARTPVRGLGSCTGGRPDER